jgi:putative membrane protein
MPASPTFSWLGGGIHPEVLLGVLLLAGLYTAAIVRSRRPTPLAQPLAFFGGCAALLLALNGPLHDLSDRYLLSAHMVQHLVLTLVTPPLWLAGTPGPVLDALVEPLLRRRPTRLLLRTLTRPLVALGVYAVALIGWHLPAFYNAALEQHGWHVAEHIILLGTAILAWWPILSPSRRLAALPYAAQLLYLFVFGIPMTVVATFVTTAERPLYPWYAAAPRLFGLSPLADQQLGGVIMWVPAGVIPLIAFTVVFFRWAASEPDDADAEAVAPHSAPR